MVNIKILAGGFSGFIATYVFDSDAASLQLVKQNPSGTNPSWIAPHAQNKTVLYAVNENSPVGDVQSFTIDADGGLTLVDTITSQGNAPTFTNPLSTGEISAVNFGSPNTTVIATDPNDPAKFIEGPTVAFPRPEGASNPHMSLEVDGEILVPDLGADTIWRVISDGKAPGAFKVQGQIDVDKGSGPRHIAVRDGVLFILHEKTSTLTAQLLPQAPNGTSAGLLANVSIIPEQRPANTSFFAAEIFISEPTEQFPEPLIYVSNRNLGPDVDPAGDTIAIFRFNNPNGTVAPPTPTDAPAATETAGQTAVPSPSSIGDEEDCDEEDPAPVAAPPPPPSNVHMMYSTKRMIKRRVHDSVISAMFYKRQEPETKPVLELVAQIPTGLQQIRSFAIGPVGAGQDEFLIAGANTEGGVAVFRRTDGGANLELVARNLDLGNRTSFVFL